MEGLTEVFQRGRKMQIDAKNKLQIQTLIELLSFQNSKLVPVADFAFWIRNQISISVHKSFYFLHLIYSNKIWG